jgi:hypothetical protein
LASSPDNLLLFRRCLLARATYSDSMVHVNLN